MSIDKDLLNRLSIQEEPPHSIERGVLIETALADQYAPANGPLGQIFVGFTPLGISSIVPTSDVNEFLVAHGRRVGRTAYPGSLPARLAGQLERTLETGRLGKLPVDLRQLTDFQRQVLAARHQVFANTRYRFPVLGFLQRRFGTGRETQQTLGVLLQAIERPGSHGLHGQLVVDTAGQ